MIKGKTLHIFVRFGGLDLKNQKGYTAEQKTYHAPPAKKGFYAMPRVAQEQFLIGSLRYQPDILPKTPQYPDEHDAENHEELVSMVAEYRTESSAFDYEQHDKRVKMIKSRIGRSLLKRRAISGITLGHFVSNQRWWRGMAHG